MATTELAQDASGGPAVGSSIAPDVASKRREQPAKLRPGAAADLFGEVLTPGAEFPRVEFRLGAFSFSRRSHSRSLSAATVARTRSGWLTDGLMPGVRNRGHGPLASDAGVPPLRRRPGPRRPVPSRDGPGGAPFRRAGLDSPARRDPSYNSCCFPCQAATAAPSAANTDTSTEAGSGSAFTADGPVANPRLDACTLRANGRVDAEVSAGAARAAGSTNEENSQQPHRSASALLPPSDYGTHAVGPTRAETRIRAATQLHGRSPRTRFARAAGSSGRLLSRRTDPAVSRSR